MHYHKYSTKITATITAAAAVPAIQEITFTLPSIFSKFSARISKNTALLSFLPL